MEFKNYQEALAYASGQVPATPKQQAAAIAWLDSPEGKAAAQEANTPRPLSKSEPKKSVAEQSAERLQKQVANSPAVQAAVSAGEKAKAAIENPPEKNEFGLKKNLQKSEDNVNKMIEKGDYTAQGDELRNVLTNAPGGGAVEGQATKPGEAAMERLEEEGKLPEETEETVISTGEVVPNVSEDDVMAAKDVTMAAEQGDLSKKDKKMYDASTMSIWDAYNRGLISKEAAGYFTIDALATLATNLGKGIGNVGAQYSGGTIDNSKEQSMWDKRKDQILSEETQIEKEGMEGPAGRKAQSETEGITAQQLANARTAITNEYTREQVEAQTAMLRKELEMAGINIDMANSKKAVIDYIKSKDGWESNPYYIYLVSSLAQSGVQGTVGTAADAIGSVVNLFK